MRPRQALYRMISETETGLACAREVKRYKESIGDPWACDDETGWKRIRQCLNGTAGRHFEVDWYPIVVRVVLEADGSDLVEPILAEARYQGRREREDVDRVRIHRVGSSESSRRVRA